MDPRRYRGSASNPAPQQKRQTIDGFMAPSRSLPKTPMAVPAVKTPHARPALPRRPQFTASPVGQDMVAARRPVALPQPKAALPAQPQPVRPAALPPRQVSPAVQPQYQRPPALQTPLSGGQRRPLAAPAKPKKKILQRRYIVIPAAIVLFCFIVSIFNRDDATAPTNSQTNQSAVTTAAEEPEVPAAPTYPTSDQEAAYTAAVQRLMTENSGFRSTVIARNLKTGKEVSLGSTEAYIAASTGKLLTAATVYQQIEQGKYTLSTKLSNSQTVKYNLETMIVDSNNASWEVLNTKVTRASLTARAKEIGMTQYVNRTNSLGAADTALLIRKLYEGSLISDTHRTQLLDWMEQANYRGYMVAATPSDFTIQHKVGIYEDVLHDAAIITKGEEVLELVVYTDGNGTPPDAARTAFIKAVTTVALANWFAPGESTATTTMTQ